MKENENRNNMKALFIQRILAFFLDIVIVSCVATLVSYPFVDNDDIIKLNDSSNEILEKYVAEEIDTNTYFMEAKVISFKLAKEYGALYIATIFIAIMYFVVYQFYNNGQTVGKKLMRIRIKSSDADELNMNNMVIRALIINSIFVDMTIFAFSIFATEDIYFYGVGIVEFIGYTIILISGLMVMFSKSGRGLHDIFSHTEVVRCDGVKEVVLCEN